jgi:hypothetical protein
MALNITNGRKIFQHFSFQGFHNLPKFSDFWNENTNTIWQPCSERQFFPPRRLTTVNFVTLTQNRSLPQWPGGRSYKTRLNTQLCKRFWKEQGCQIFLCEIYQNTPSDYKIYEMTIALPTKSLQNSPNGDEICHNFPFQGLPQYTKNL